MNSSATKIIAVVVILVIVVAACAVVLTSDDSDDSSGSDFACLPVFGNADEDIDIDKDDLEIIQNIIDGVDGYTLSAYPFADANYDGQVTSADVTLVNKIINNESTTVYHYMYTNDGGDDVTASVVSTSWPNTKVMTSYCSVLYLSVALGLSENVVAAGDLTGYNYGGVDYYYYDQTLFADIADHAIAMNVYSAESIISAMNETGATLLVCSGYGDYDITDSMIGTLEAAGIDVVRICESNPVIEPTVASVLLYGFLMGVEDTAQELAEFYSDVWYESLEIADSIADSDRIKATYTVAGPENQYTYKITMAGGDYAYENASADLNEYGSYTFGDWIYNVEIDCMVTAIWANSTNGSYFGELDAQYILDYGIDSNYKTLDVYKEGNFKIINGDTPTALTILMYGYAMYPEYYGDLYTSAMTTMLAFFDYDYEMSGFEWVYSTADLEAML